MSEGKAEPNYRLQRVERLLEELRYEVTRGMIEGDFPGEQMGLRFYVPVSKEIPNGVVVCEFRTRPMVQGQWCPDDLEPKLRVVK